jgi:TonB-linked SusC/RagA family outer membrane protein
MIKLLRTKRFALFMLFGIGAFIQTTAKAAAPPHQAVKKQADTLSVNQLTVIDENYSPLANVRLYNQRTKAWATSDEYGVAKLSAVLNDEISVSILNQVILSYIISAERPVITLSSKNPLVTSIKQIVITNNITLSPALTATSTQAVYNNDLVKMPVTSTKNAVIGRLAGVHTLQSSGRPSADDATLTLRGQDPLIIIDGIPRNLASLDQEEIESVTVLKDALSTVGLGLRSSGGALIITTKKGISGAPKISFTAQGGIQSSIKAPQFLDAYTYANLYNEAIANDNLATGNNRAPAYSATDLVAYQTGSDPIGHPNVNWQDQVFNKTSLLSRYDLNIKGGDNIARYYVGLEYLNQEGDLKQSPINTYSTNNNFNNFTVRSNIDINLTPKTILGINIFGRIINSSAPGVGGGTDIIYASILNTPNLAYPVFNDDGSYGGAINFPSNIYAQSVGSGYVLNYKRDIMSDISLKRSLDEVTKGLWAQALVSSYSTLSENTNRSKSFATFQEINNAGVITYKQFGNNGVQANSTSNGYQSRQFYAEGAIGYKRQFGLHGIDAQLRVTSDNYYADNDLPLNYYGGSGRVSYNYDGRYSAEFAVGVNRTNRYPDATPMGVFPAAGLAWHISKEKFMPTASWLNDLKLFASYGKTGNDVAGYYVYNQYYTGGGTYYFGTTPTSFGGERLNGLANTTLTWEKADKLNVGLSTMLFNNKLSAQVEYYNNKYYDLLINPNVSSIVGITVPNQNIGINRYRGVELQLNWQQNIGKFNYYISGNASLMKTQVIYQSEVYRQYDYQRRTGLPVGQAFGYIADGLFQTQAEINSSAKIAGYTPIPGDIKYKDLNHDGVIDQLDQAALGTTNPVIDYGGTLGFNYNGFDFSMLVQGVANRNELITGNSVWEFQNNGFGQAYPQNLNRWTPATAATATYPRVSVGTNANNDITSSFWMHSGDYFRLKNIELGYTVSSKAVSKFRISSIRFFVSGTNLFTHAAYDVVDPETNSGGYPIQRVINGGINIKL